MKTEYAEIQRLLSFTIQIRLIHYYRYDNKTSNSIHQNCECYANGRMGKSSATNWNWKQTNWREYESNIPTNFWMIKNWHQLQHFNKLCMQFLPVFCWCFFLWKKNKHSFRCECNEKMKKSIGNIMCLYSTHLFSFGFAEWCPDSFNSHSAI